MQISDLFRQLADALDNIGDSELKKSPENVFVPPLQQKIELLKKSVGVENIYDDPETEEVEQHSYPDELLRIKTIAGISDLADDEPLDV